MFRALFTHIALADPGIRPNSHGLPALSLLKSIAGALMTFGLVFSVMAIVIGGAAYGIGAYANNGRLSSMGLKGIGGGIVGAIVVAAAPSLVKFFSDAGGTI